MSDITPKIRQILETQLNNSVSVDIAWEKSGYTPDARTTYIRPIFAPTIRVPVCIGDDPQLRYQGLLYLELMVPEESSVAEDDQLASQVLDAFETNSILTDGTYQVQIRRSERGQGVPDTSWNKTQVIINWFTYN